MQGSSKLIEEYIKMFETLLNRLTQMIIKKDLEKELNRILDEIIRDMGVIWSCYKRNNYNISDEEEKSFYWILENHNNNLDEIAEKYGILKGCPKCYAEFPATTKYFYIDRSRRGGLSVVCKQCFRAIQRNNYKRKKKTKMEKKLLK